MRPANDTVRPDPYQPSSEVFTEPPALPDLPDLPDVVVAMTPREPAQPARPVLVEKQSGLSVHNLGKTYSKRPVVRNVSINVQRGEARRLDAELARHQADAGLQQQLADKREELGAKQALMQQLGSLSLQKSRGYAGVMADLARLRDARLSLQRIEISDGRINLSGVAERSQDVPAWVNRFKQTPTLAGAQFGELTLSRDKEGRLAFQLSGMAREAP